MGNSTGFPTQVLQQINYKETHTAGQPPDETYLGDPSASGTWGPHSDPASDQVLLHVDISETILSLNRDWIRADITE